jgi:DNA-binding Xre family transcriptional regulator
MVSAELLEYILIAINSVNELEAGKASNINTW